MFNADAYKNLINKQPLMAGMLKRLGKEYLDFSLSDSSINKEHLRRFYYIADSYKIFSGVDLSTEDVKEMLDYIA